MTDEPQPARGGTRGTALVETEPGFVIVEKDGHAGVVADLADPRAAD